MATNPGQACSKSSRLVLSWDIRGPHFVFGNTALEGWTRQMAREKKWKAEIRP